MQLDKFLNQGGIYINHSFLSQEDFNYIDFKFMNYDFDKSYQPSGIIYGNRFQAYPTYESDLLEVIDPKFNQLFLEQIQTLFPDKTIIDWQASLRYTSSDEVLMSKQNTRYGISHIDNMEYAGVLYLDQTSTGGTAFFRTAQDKIPDIEVGSLPNRCIVYNGNMIHAPSNDFTFDIRRILIFFFDIADK